MEIKENASYMALPEFQTYIALIEMLHSTEHEHYFQYKDLVFKNLALWDNEDKINFISFLLNYMVYEVIIKMFYQLYIYSNNKYNKLYYHIQSKNISLFIY